MIAWTSSGKAVAPALVARPLPSRRPLLQVSSDMHVLLFFRCFLSDTKSNRMSLWLHTETAIQSVGEPQIHKYLIEISTPLVCGKQAPGPITAAGLLQHLSNKCIFYVRPACTNSLMWKRLMTPRCMISEYRLVDV